MRTNQLSPFGTGPRLADESIGDPSREAVASLRGYAYQLYASALAWIDLQSEEELHLEVAEDYAVAANDALRAVQVKDTGPTSVTINSDGVRDTIESFVKLVELNPERQVYLHYLTTSPVGLERSRDHRIAGKATLEYWRQAATSAEVTPLRHLLLALGFSKRVQQYISNRDDRLLRDELFKRIQWDCGQPELQIVQDELAIRLGRYGAEKLGLSADEGKQLSGTVIKHVLDAVVRDKPRVLSARGLETLLNDATSMRVPRRVANALLQAAFDQMAGQQGPVSVALVPRVLEPEADRPMPLLLAGRQALIDDVVGRVRNGGVALITGGTGKGKTIVARLAAHALGGVWNIVDLRNASAAETIPHLDQASVELPVARSAGLILDDLNEIDDPTARRAVIRILSVARRNDVTCLVNAYNRPSARSLADLGIPGGACVAVPDFTVDELKEMIVRAGGDSRWAQTIHLAGAFGHPQLVSALISGLSSRSWPLDELKSLYLFEPSDDVEAERLAARRQLVDVVPDDAKALLYRVSLIIGRFERQTVLSLAQLKPTIRSPGQQLDLLVGAWVEQYAKQQLRVSPLLANAGREMLTAEEQKSVHRALAEYYTREHALNVSQADEIFLHGLAGKSESALMRLAAGILFAEQSVRPMLADWITGVRLYRKDRPIYPTNMRLSVLLRIAQMLLLANGKRQPDDIERSWEALQREAASASDAKTQTDLEMLALGKLLSDVAMAALLPDWVGQLVRLVEYAEKDRKLLKELKRPVPGIEAPSLAGMLFLMQVAGINSVAALRSVFDRLDSLQRKTRNKLLADAASMPSDFSIFVNRPWLEEHKGGSIDWRAGAENYLAMASLAEKWGIRSLSLRCHIARGVMFDEYAQNPDEALRALDEAGQKLGADPVLSRARAKIHYRRKDHAQALALLRDSAQKAARNDFVEQAFMFREAGISAAETGDWAEAARWFAAAYQAAVKASSESMKLMTVGLCADQGVAAFQAGDLPTALKLLATALTGLPEFDPASSYKVGYCHRVIRHATLCVSMRVSGKAEMLKDQHLAIVPGMCSNPEPPDISDLPSGHIDIAWYLLAEAEIAGGAGSSINDSLRSKLGGTIPSCEVTLSEVRTATAIRLANPVGFVTSLSSWLEAILYVQSIGDRYKEFSAEKPAYGEIDKATEIQLQSQNAKFAAEDALLAFGMSVAIQARPEALQELSTLVAATTLDQSLKELAACMAGKAEKRDYLEGRLAADIWRIAQQGSNLQPDEVFVGALQFVQRIAISNLKTHLAQLLAVWLRARWSHALAQQTFLLRSPNSNRLPIKRVIAIEENSLAYCAHFLLTVSSAATTRLAESFRMYLASLANQK